VSAPPTEKVEARERKLPAAFSFPPIEIRQRLWLENLVFDLILSKQHRSTCIAQFIPVENSQKNLSFENPQDDKETAAIGDCADSWHTYLDMAAA
jgi:hypothetical protein